MTEHLAPIGLSKAERTRARLVECALVVIARNGEFTGEQVAEAAGVSTPTFYSHFATKDHAIAACLETCFNDYLRYMREAESIELLLQTDLLTVLNRIVSVMMKINDEYQQLMRLFGSRLRASSLLRDVSRHQQRSALESTVKFITLAQSAGRVREGDPLELAGTMRTVLHGLDSWMVRSIPGLANEHLPMLLCAYLAPVEQMPQTRMVQGATSSSN